MRDLKGEIHIFSYIIDLIGLKAGNYQIAGILSSNDNIVPMEIFILTYIKWF